MKSPVASGALACCSVKNLVRVMMSVLMFSWPTGGAPPLFAIVDDKRGRMCVQGVIVIEVRRRRNWEKSGDYI